MARFGVRTVGGVVGSSSFSRRKIFAIRNSCITTVMPNVRSRLIDWMFTPLVADDENREHRKNEVNQRKTFAIRAIGRWSESSGVFGDRSLARRRQLDRHLHQQADCAPLCQPYPDDDNTVVPFPSGRVQRSDIAVIQNPSLDRAAELASHGGMNPGVPERGYGP